MAKEVMVPMHKINEVIEDSNLEKGLVAHLDNGMLTNVVIGEDGVITTKTDDDALIKYLEDPFWTGLRETAVLLDGKLIVRQYEDDDLNQVIKIMVDTVDFGGRDNPSERIKMEKITARTIKMFMNAVKENGLQYYIVQYEDSIIGQILCTQRDDIMRLDPTFKSLNENEVYAAAQAMKLVMRRLPGIFEFEAYGFDFDEDQIPVIEALGIDMDNPSTEITMDKTEEQIKFYL